MGASGLSAGRFTADGLILQMRNNIEGFFDRDDGEYHD
jgi:hypothetical protein